MIECPIIVYFIIFTASSIALFITSTMAFADYVQNSRNIVDENAASLYQQMTNLVFIFGIIYMVLSSIGCCIGCFSGCVSSSTEESVSLSVGLSSIMTPVSFIASLVYIILGYQVKYEVNDVCSGQYNTNYTITCNFYNNKYNPVIISLTVYFSILAFGTVAFCFSFFCLNYTITKRR